MQLALLRILRQSIAALPVGTETFAIEHLMVDVSKKHFQPPEADAGCQRQREEGRSKDPCHPLQVTARTGVVGKAAAHAGEQL